MVKERVIQVHTFIHSFKTYTVHLFSQKKMYCKFLGEHKVQWGDGLENSVKIMGLLQ
jgi:hypothetical protein